MGLVALVCDFLTGTVANRGFLLQVLLKHFCCLHSPDHGRCTGDMVVSVSAVSAVSADWQPLLVIWLVSSLRWKWLNDLFRKVGHASAQLWPLLFSVTLRNIQLAIFRSSRVYLWSICFLVRSVWFIDWSWIRFHRHAVCRMNLFFAFVACMFVITLLGLRVLLRTGFLRMCLFVRLRFCSYAYAIYMFGWFVCAAGGLHLIRVAMVLCVCDSLLWVHRLHVLVPSVARVWVCGFMFCFFGCMM